MTKYSYVLILIFNFFVGFSQNIPFEKEFFLDRKEELKDARAKLQTGTDFYIQGRKIFEEFRKQYLITNRYYPLSVYDYEKTGSSFFQSALGLLNEANRFNPQNADLNYMLGFIWFNNDPINPETIKFLEKAQALETKMGGDVAYWLGWAYHLNSRWDDAIIQYELYLKWLQSKVKVSPALIDEVKKKLEECASGKILSASPEKVFVDNLGPAINTAHPEYGPAITTDEETIFYTSRRPGSVGGKKEETDNGFFEDVYTSTKIKNAWVASKQLSKSVNTEGHDAAAGLSPDGSKLYVYRYTGYDGGDLYESVLFGLDWEEPKHMNKNINTKYHESSVSLSFDGRHLYFISDKESGLGGRDIFLSEMDVNGEWGLSKNMGPVINTKYPEDGVFVHPDGVTLYFSSKGHGSMGGYDIFRSTYVNGRWQAPVNLGYPINGPDDDVFFVVSGSGNRAYFASSKIGGYGEKDIYKITFLGPEKQPLLNSQDQLLAMIDNPFNNLKAEGEIEVSSAKLTLLKGQVMDEKTEKPLESTIELIDNEKNLVLATFKSNLTTGKYLVTLPSGKNYGVVVKCNGYLFHSENFNLPQATDYQEFNLNFALKKLEVGSTVILKNIFFDFNEASIKSESENELTRLIGLLKENPTVKIEIGSHTDNIGSSEYNNKLSNSRSNSVLEYLVSKGVSTSKVIAKGYGETKPKSSNESEEGRQNNRRTEFKILSK
jgi:outer membrane protein OmpA-like peptidoglycan-associated protein